MARFSAPVRALATDSLKFLGPVCHYKLGRDDPYAYINLVKDGHPLLHFGLGDRSVPSSQTNHESQ